MNLIVKSVGENSADYNFNDLISKDNNGNVEIKCFYSFILKIKLELNQEKQNKSEIRPIFNIKFDCKNNININLTDFKFNSNYITFANQV